MNSRAGNEFSLWGVTPPHMPAFPLIQRAEGLNHDSTQGNALGTIGPIIISPAICAQRAVRTDSTPSLTFLDLSLNPQLSPTKLPEGQGVGVGFIPLPTAAQFIPGNPNGLAITQPTACPSDLSTHISRAIIFKKAKIVLYKTSYMM